MDLSKIKELAKKSLGNKYIEKGEKFYHGERVASLVLKLRKHIYPNDPTNDDILFASALFHDIMHGNANHAAEGARMVREVLSPYCSEPELDEICNIINVHDDRNSGQNYSGLIKLHQDADFLDHFGVFDIWRNFIYAIPQEKSIIDTIDYLVQTRPVEYEKYRRELNFDISKKIFDEKAEFLVKFADRFKVECTGGIWDEEKLLAK